MHDGEINPTAVVFNDGDWFYLCKYVKCQNKRSPMLIHKVQLPDARLRDGATADVFGCIHFQST